MAIRVPALVLVCLLVTGGVARAQGPEPAPPGTVEAMPAQEPEPEPPTREEIARGVVRNVRRMIAIGPTVGTFGSYAYSPGDFDAGLSFGLELAVFKTRLPTPARVREIAKEKALEKLTRIIAERFGGQRPDRATLEQLMREIAAQVKAEVIAAINSKPPVLERPRFAIPFEANYLFGPADWMMRFGLGIGIGPVAIGPTFSVRFGEDIVARLGPDLTVRLLPMSSPRSPVIDIFLRGDFELHARETKDDQITLGVRLLLDII